MKAISASIIVLIAAALIYCGSCYAQCDAESRLFVQIAGSIVGLAGLVGWFMVLREK